MKRIITGILLSAGLLFGMFEFQGEEPVAIQMGYARMALPDATGAVFYNPAALSRPMTLGKAFFFSQYSTSGLGIVVYGAGIRYKNFAFSMIERGAKLEGDYSGRYSEGRYSLSYGRSISDNLTAGITLKTYKFSEPRYGASYSPSLDLGLIAKKNQWRLGFYWVNVAGTDLRNEDIPEYAQVAIGFKASPLSCSLLQIEAQSGKDLRVSFGEQINLVENIIKVRGGVMHQGSLNHFAVGFTVHYAALNIDYSVLFIPDMPISHSIGISFRR